MSVTVREARKQIYGTKSGSRVYRIQGTLDYAEAVSAVLGGEEPLSPAQWGDLSLDDFNCEEKGNLMWELTSSYGRAAVEIFPGDVLASIDTTGGSVHQTHTDLDGTSYPSNAGDFKGAIGVGEDGSIAGIDRPTPRLGLCLKTRFTSAQMTDAYIAQVFQATGRINSAAWRGFKAQELLFIGARLDQINALQWDAQFIFQGEYEKSNFAIGSVSGITKKGWQYLWVYTTAKEETIVAGGQKVNLPDAKVVRVDNIFETVNFNLLSIPGNAENPFGFQNLPHLH